MSDESQITVAETSGQTSAAVKKRAIVLVPGLKREERFSRRDVLVRNLLSAERTSLSDAGEIEVAGEQCRRLTMEPLRGIAGNPASASNDRLAEVDVFEAFWADMIPEISERTPWQRLLWGFEIIAYWVLNWRSWTALPSSKYMTLGLLAGGSLLVLWYISLTLLAIQAIGQDPPETLANVTWLTPVLEAFKEFGNWQFWLAIAAVLPFLKVDELVLIASFVKDYLLNKPDMDESGLRQRLRKRIRRTLDNVYKAGYDEVTILSHSFGTILAIDLMADWPHPDDLARTTLVTMGSPATVLTHRSPWFAEEVKRLSQRKELAAWEDYHARTDWLCAEVPQHKAFPGAGKSHAMTFDAGLMEVLSGRTHMHYYRNGDLLEQLVQPRPL